MKSYNDIYSNNDSIKDTGFYYYLKTLDVADNSDVLILSPVHHYYYDFSEIRNVKTLIHMKELNKIGDLKKFINSTIRVLSDGSLFIGCFMDNHIHKNIIYNNRFLYWLTNCFSTRIHRYLSRKKMIKMFLDLGFEIMDISEINGLSYFCVKK